MGREKQSCVEGLVNQVGQEGDVKSRIWTGSWEDQVIVRNGRKGATHNAAAGAESASATPSLAVCDPD
jgi:hypothetical protein